MITVLVEDDNLERAIRRLRKELVKDNTLKDYKERQYYTKPSTKEHKKRRLNERKREWEKKTGKKAK